MSVKENTITLVDRQGAHGVVRVEYAQKLEDQLNRAKGLLKELAIHLVPPPGVSMLDIIKGYAFDSRVLDLIKEYDLCVLHNPGAKAKERDGEWSVQTDNYSELFTRATLEEAVEACVNRIETTRPTVYVDALLTKKD
jgi:hypothetical protein